MTNETPTLRNGSGEKTKRLLFWCPFCRVTGGSVTLPCFFLVGLVLFAAGMTYGDEADGLNGSESGDIAFVSIPGGSFRMGDTENIGFSGEKPVHTVTLPGFAMSACEITNIEYAGFLNEALTAGEITVNDSSVGDTSNGQVYFYLIGNYDANNKCWIRFDSGVFTVEPGKEQWPVVYVTWFGARAFALFYGFDLPTESEWEHACRGGTQLTYGTDDGTIDNTNANYDSSVGYPLDVGSYTPNPFGLSDMSGNVWEWCSDWYERYPEQDENNPTGPETGSFRIVRGGGWKSHINQCRSAFRFRYSPDFAYYDIGFRVVRRGTF